MIIRFKDAAKLIGISIIACCAVFVCTLFLNFNLDLVRIKDLITAPPTVALYDAMVMMGKVVSAVSGGCLLLTSVIMLFFYIKHYIDAHKKELGILKAIGYSNIKIASGFWVFGFSVFLGSSVGFCGSFALMPLFYKTQNEDNVLTGLSIHFNFELAIWLVIIPSIFFMLLAVIYSYFKLKRPTLELLRGMGKPRNKKIKHNDLDKSQLSFLSELKKSTVKSRFSLVFFIWFASFCFSSMMQMSFSMDDLASAMFAVIIILIGIVLSCTTLFIAVTTVVTANTKTISMMRVFGYSFKECGNTILSGYRPIAYFGFAIGTVYQYGLLKIVVSIFSKTLADIPEFNFDFTALGIVLLSFALIYELIMYWYTKRIKNISIKEVMLEG